MNTILDDRHREQYEHQIRFLTAFVPADVAQKDPRAMVQQAWMYDFLSSYTNPLHRILCVGGHRDVPLAALRRQGYENITDIDPEYNTDLNNYRLQNPDERFHCVYSNSVIEHVTDDEHFIRQMCECLEPGGIAAITADFNPDYPRVAKPREDTRLYTTTDFTIRLRKVLQECNCDVLGPMNYEGTCDFKYSGCWYAFASYAWRKNA
jgi:SAM-dependent methyltransferase